MPAFRDLTNQVFGRLTALRCVGRAKSGGARWLCHCSCDGKEKEVAGSNLLKGNTTSCGCFQREMAATRGSTNPNFKHGRSHTPIYRAWSGLINRCENPQASHYEYYGGATPPVRVCDRWRNSFEAFLADMGERPAGTSLGRYGDIGNYEPGNCAWQTKREQIAEQKLKCQRAALAA
jgi:hypothetical protein